MGREDKSAGSRKQEMGDFMTCNQSTLTRQFVSGEGALGLGDPLSICWFILIMYIEHLPNIFCCVILNFVCYDFKNQIS